jgi:peptidoglycan L-alanyl-D-glutamate endopeptidase CwlK
MILSEKQKIFTQNIAKLIDWAYANGFELTFGEVWRSPEQQALYVKQGKSKTMNSRHLDRLAVDFNVFKNNTMLNDPKFIQPLGEYWMTLDKDNVWGNDWNRNHSIEDEKFSDPYHFEMKP